MTTRTSRLVGIAAVLLVVAGVFLGTVFPVFLQQEGSSPGGVDAPLPALPIFDAQLKTIEGVDVTLGDYQGDILVINFWATWCFPCRIEIPDFIEFSTRYKEKGVRVIGIAVDESGPAAVRRFAEEIGMNYPVLIGDRDVTEAFGGILGFPSTFLVARDGTLYSRYTGLAPKAQIEQDIRYLLAERT